MFMIITTEVGISHRKLVGYRFHLLKIHICFEYVICLRACWKAAGCQIGCDVRDGWQKWKRQGRLLQQQQHSRYEYLLLWKSSLYWPSSSLLVCLSFFSQLLHLLHSLFVLVFFCLYWSHDTTILVYSLIETLNLYFCLCVLEYNNVSSVGYSSALRDTFMPRTGFSDAKLICSHLLILL